MLSDESLHAERCVCQIDTVAPPNRCRMSAQWRSTVLMLTTNSSANSFDVLHDTSVGTLWTGCSRQRISSICFRSLTTIPMLIDFSFTTLPVTQTRLP